MIEAVRNRLQADVIDAGPLRIAKRTKTVGGWDHGTFGIGDHTVPYLNEYLAVENADGRVATYPDTIVIINKARIIATGALAEITDGHASLEEAFFALTGSEPGREEEISR